MIVRRFVITRVTSTEIHHTKVSLKKPDNNKPKSLIEKMVSSPILERFSPLSTACRFDVILSFGGVVIYRSVAVVEPDGVDADVDGAAAITAALLLRFFASETFSSRHDLVSST